MGYDVVVVGGGTAGCVLAARLSEDPARSVCLVEAGPDYGPLRVGRWPRDMSGARLMPTSHDWGTGGEDGRTLGARIIGGCSAHNACVVLAGTPADYDEWGGAWAHARFAPYLARARSMLQVRPANTDRPAPAHVAFLAAAQAMGLPRLDDPDDPEHPVGVAPYPANVVGDTRWNTAFAYLDPARDRPNLTVLGDTLADRVQIEGERARGVQLADGHVLDAGTVVLAAGAYFSPALLLRSGIGPESELVRLGVRVTRVLPVGERLLDHCGTGLGWEPSELLNCATAEHERDGELFESHAVVKAASSDCEPGGFDLHLLSWTNRASEPGRYTVSAGLFLMKPASSGRLRLRSTDPRVAPEVTRGFLSDPRDVAPLLEGIELARSIAGTEPLRNLLATEVRPGPVEPERYLRDTVRNYFHPAGTCAMGEVVDTDGRVLGIESLVVADASIMPTIPRANTNLTTAAIAERIAETF